MPGSPAPGAQLAKRHPEQALRGGRGDPARAHMPVLGSAPAGWEGRPGACSCSHSAVPLAAAERRGPAVSDGAAHYPRGAIYILTAFSHPQRFFNKIKTNKKPLQIPPHVCPNDQMLGNTSPQKEHGKQQCLIIPPPSAAGIQAGLRAERRKQRTKATRARTWETPYRCQPQRFRPGARAGVGWGRGPWTSACL